MIGTMAVCSEKENYNFFDFSLCVSVTSFLGWHLFELLSALCK